MAEHCKFYRCDRMIEKDGYCFLHKMYSGAGTGTTAEKKAEVKPTGNAKPKKKIAAQSKKRKKEQPIYVAMVKEAAAENDNCEIKSPVCTGKMQGFHHVQKSSPKNRLDRKNLKRACNACNEFIETDPEWAQENGHFISKFKK